jgi:uncharacterized protein YndB with AHSA1/START domain
MTSTRITQHIRAPRATVYSALHDAQAVARWKVPDGMTCEVHQFEPREGGALRVSTADNELGWRLALAKLAALVEAG